MTRKTAVMAVENSTLNHLKKLHFKSIFKRNLKENYFKLQYFTVLLLFAVTYCVCDLKINGYHKRLCLTKYIIMNELMDRELDRQTD